MYLNIGMLRDIKCKHCSSKNFYKKGYRKTDHRGKIQKYYCKECGYKFIKNEVYKGKCPYCNKFTVEKLEDAEKLLRDSTEVPEKDSWKEAIRSQIEIID